MNNAALTQIRRWQTGENRYCFECKTGSPTWASLPYGIYLCYNCSGLHRGMGVHLSFVRSIEMDSWTDKQLSMMQKGGNEALRRFFEAHDIQISDSNKYKTNAANYYRERMRALVNETEIPDEPTDWTALQEALKQAPPEIQIASQQSQGELPPENNVCGKLIAKFWEQAQQTTKQAITKMDEKISKVNIKEEAILIGQQLQAKTKELGDKSSKVADKAIKSLKKGFDDAFGFIKSKAEQVISKDVKQQPQQQTLELNIESQPQIKQINQPNLLDVQATEIQKPLEEQFQQQQKVENLIDYEEYFTDGPTSQIIYEKPIYVQPIVQEYQKTEQKDLLDLFNENNSNQRPQQQQSQGQQAIANLLDL